MTKLITDPQITGMQLFWDLNNGSVQELRNPSTNVCGENEHLEYWRNI